MRAVGYRPVHFIVMLAAESAALLVGGVLVGGCAALLAVAPAFIERGGRLPVSTNALVLLVLVLASGIVSTLVAARDAVRGPLLAALRRNSGDGPALGFACPALARIPREHRSGGQA